MNRTKKILLIIFSIFAIILIGVGITYAIFSARILGTDSASVITLEVGELEITIDGGPNIVATGILPDSDNPWATKIITVTGKNTTRDLYMPYTLKLVVDRNTFSAGSIKYSLSGTNVANSGDIIEDQELVTIDSTKTLGSGYFAPGRNMVHRYVLELYFPETYTDQSADMRAVFNAHVTINSYNASKTIPGPEWWENAPKGSLIAEIKNTNRTNSVYFTTPGVQNGSLNEGLRTTEDDYGTSYYYRGDVTNNYIVYAGMCWRIVRVDGNGNIKIVLANYDKSAEHPCESTNTSAAFARNTSDVQIATRFSSITNKNAYIGFMYGTPVKNKGNMTNEEAYDTEHENKYESLILTVLETWYENNIVKEGEFDYSNSLADVIWCNDKSLASTQIAGSTDYTNLGYNNEKTWYGAAERLISPTALSASQNANPTLKCPDASGNDKDLSRFTTTTSLEGNKKLNYPIGLLTVDEVAFAGGAFRISNSKYYLNKNASSSNWWTISPNDYYGSAFRFFEVISNGRIDFSLNDNLALRPAVSLKSTVKVTTESNENPGTAGNPFIVR